MKSCAGMRRLSIGTRANICGYSLIGSSRLHLPRWIGSFFTKIKKNLTNPPTIESRFKLVRCGLPERIQNRAHA